MMSRQNDLMTLEGVTHGGVGRHAADIIAEDGPHVLVAFLKVYITYLLYYQFINCIAIRHLWIRLTIRILGPSGHSDALGHQSHVHQAFHSLFLHTDI